MGLDKEKLLASAGHTADVNDLAGLQQALLALTQHTWSTIFLTEESLRQAHEQSDLTLEQFLVQQANVPMVELIQHIIELKGVYGFYVANIFVEGGINHLIPISTAYGLQVLPLAFLTGAFTACPAVITRWTALLPLPTKRPAMNFT